MGFRICVLPEVFAAGPIAKLSEGDVLFGVVVLQQFFKFCFGVFDLNAPSCQMRLAGDELGFAESAVLESLLGADVESVEEDPVVVVLPEVDEQVSELCLGDVVVAESVRGFDFALCCSVGPDDHWLQLEQLWQLEHISDSLVDLRQAEVAVVVHVELPVDLEAFGAVFGRNADGDTFHLGERGDAHEDMLLLIEL